MEDSLLSLQYNYFPLHEICPGLYVGDYYAFSNRHYLDERNITHVVSAMDSLFEDIPHKSDFKHLIVKVDDATYENIIEHFEESYQFIHQARKDDKNVLIHCQAGVSRSATLAIAYLMKENNYSSEQAFMLVKIHRPIIFPNEEFYRQLRLYDKIHYNLDLDNPLYRKFLVSWKSNSEKDKMHILAKDPAKSAAMGAKGHGKGFRCKKCRRLLATSQNEIDHSQGNGQSSFSYHKRDKSFQHYHSSSECSSIFVEPMEWMKCPDLEGKLNCPKCHAKLGSYNWSGSQCSCGTWVTPFFSLLRNKIDEV